MLRSSCVIVASAILFIASMASMTTAQGTADTCTQDSVYIINLYGTDLWYKRDGSACTYWKYSAFNIPIRPGERIEVFSDLTCQTPVCDEPLTYEISKSADRNGNCIIKVDYPCKLRDA